MAGPTWWSKVTRPTATEHGLRPSQTIMAFLHMAVASPDFLVALHNREITAIAYEMIERPNGERPLLVPMSEVAGRLAPMVAGQLLMTHSGGRGTCCSGIPGVPRGVVAIISGGVLGANARPGLPERRGAGRRLDNDIRRLQHLDRCSTAGSRPCYRPYSVDRVTEFADVIVGAVLWPGRRAPVLITREMISHMRPGAVFIDFSIDQGGCSETSRPTTLRDQTYIVDGVIHYSCPI